ncbi:uncharacterized protein LOC143854346 isoform X2 [Tasmannia lanceolata]|uniref:uncharacterized protein LOC143854346 isoform X2 n=1 Tax=Tasmannia lanceolata TaxID=3420 RepID=UPI0040632677
MNRAVPEKLHCLPTPENFTGGDLTAVEMQRARLKWQQQKTQEREPNKTHLNLFPLPLTQQLQTFPAQNSGGMTGFSSPSANNDHCSENAWPEFKTFTNLATDSRGLDYSISRTASCPSTGNVLPEEKGGDPVLAVGKESFKKRKADKAQNQEATVKEDSGREKRVKGDEHEAESKDTEQNSNRETSADSSKENSKISEVQKPDYIHVRARRGQATDSHSLAERVRREKISERMKYLQDLVPGCNKITGKAGMLDEIINYVQSLQRQVEFLSMKLATVNPRLDFNIDNFFAEEAHGSSSTWDVDLQTLYNSEFHQGRLSAFPSQPFPGNLEANNLKMEM